MNGGASDMESEKQTRRRAPWGRLIFGMVTSVVLVAAVLGICMTPLPAGLVDKPKVTRLPHGAESTKLS